MRDQKREICWELVRYLVKPLVTFARHGIGHSTDTGGRGTHRSSLSLSLYPQAWIGSLHRHTTTSSIVHHQLFNRDVHCWSTWRERVRGNRKELRTAAGLLTDWRGTRCRPSSPFSTVPSLSLSHFSHIGPSRLVWIDTVHKSERHLS